MNSVYQQVSMFLSHAIRGLDCPELLDLDVASIMREAEAHDIEGLMYKVLKNQVDLSAYKQAVIFKSLRQATYFKKSLETLDILQRSGVTIVLLKGSVLKSCYSQADLRMMGDVDILVPRAQLEKVHEILTHLGYTRRKAYNEKHHVYDGDGFYLEVHWSLINASRQHGTQFFEENLWNRLEPIEIKGRTFWRLGNEDFLIHLIVHMAGHFKTGGFGIRHLCDLVLWMEQQEISTDYVINQLKTMNLLTFTAYLMAMCEELLDFKVPIFFKGIEVNQIHLQDFIDTLFQGGVHGHREKGTRFGHYFAYGEHKNNSWRIFLQSVFPNIRYLSRRYTYAHKHHWLLPIAWIDRFFRVIFHQSYSFSEKLYILVKTPTIAKKKAKLLKKLDLVEKCDNLRSSLSHSL